MEKDAGIVMFKCMAEERFEIGPLFKDQIERLMRKNNLIKKINMKYYFCFVSIISQQLFAKKLHKSGL